MLVQLYILSDKKITGDFLIIYLAFEQPYTWQ